VIYIYNNLNPKTPLKRPYCDAYSAKQIIHEHSSLLQNRWLCIQSEIIERGTSAKILIYSKEFRDCSPCEHKTRNKHPGITY
jgi:hypothetical protein